MKNVLIALAVTALGLNTLGTTAQAEGPNQLRLAPKVVPQPSAPKLGFVGQMEDSGLRVLQVLQGTPAKQIGLEPGDQIVRVNGIWINSIHQYQFALTRYNGTVKLLVRDIRTGDLVTVNGYVPMNNNGPVLFKAAPATEAAEPDSQF